MATLTSVSVEEKIRNEHGAVTEFPTCEVNVLKTFYNNEQ